MIELLKQWAVTLGGAAIICALAQGMMPAKSMEKEMKLVLSLVILVSFFSAITRVDFSALVEWGGGDQSVQAFQAAGRNTTLSATLLVAREELRATLESDISQAFGQEFTVEEIVFGGAEHDVQVEEVIFHSLHGVQSVEIMRYLENRFGLAAQVGEVNQG